MISTVISYCSLDHRFISALIKQALIFSDDIVIVTYDHLLNGKPENHEFLLKFTQNSKVNVIILPFSPGKHARYYHNLARWVGAYYSHYGWIMYLDGDEIPEGAVVRSRLIEWSPFSFDACSFKCYWYFRDPKFQAIQTEECGLLVRKSAVTQDLIFSDSERWSYKYDPKIKFSAGLSDKGKPMFHHFSWVRTYNEMLDKVSAWGHMHDRNWRDEIEKEFSGEFSGKDFVHGYSYRKVENLFEISLKQLQTTS